MSCMKASNYRQQPLVLVATTVTMPLADFTAAITSKPRAPQARVHAARNLRRLSVMQASRSSALASKLERTIDGEVRFDDCSRALYATGASNYRQTPIGVVIPRTVQDGVETVRLCREHGAPLLSRGGGTSLCGQCCNEAVVLD
jgi:hypothetical protein